MNSSSTPPPPANPKPRRPNFLRRLRTLGFDLSTYSRDTGYYRPRCSQCSAIVINGVPCHETGCPHSRSPDPNTAE